MKTSNTAICNLFLVLTLFTSHAAMADEPVATATAAKTTTTSVETPEETRKATETDMPYLTDLRLQLTEDLTQQLTTAIRSQVQATLIELAAAVKQVVSN